MGKYEERRLRKPGPKPDRNKPPFVSQNTTNTSLTTILSKPPDPYINRLQNQYNTTNPFALPQARPGHQDSEAFHDLLMRKGPPDALYMGRILTYQEELLWRRFWHNAVLNHWRRKPEPIKKAILRMWPHFEGQMNRVAYDPTFRPVHMDLDPRPIMAMAMYSPGKEAADLMRVLPEELINLYLLCSRREMVTALVSFKKEAEEVRKHREAQRKWEDLPHSPLDDAMAYYDLFLDSWRFWQAGKPDMLSDFRTDFDDTHFSHDPNRPLLRREHVPEWMCPKFMKKLQRSCRDNLRPDGPETFVAEMDVIIDGFKYYFATYGHNSTWLPPLLPEWPIIDGQVRGLDFNVSAVGQVFNRTMPLLRVIMNLFGITMYTDTVVYLSDV